MPSAGLGLDCGFGSAGTAALSASADDFFLEGNNLSLAATSTRTFQATDYYRSAGQPRVAVPTWFVAGAKFGSAPRIENR